MPDLPAQMTRAQIARNVMDVPNDVSINPAAVPSLIDQLRALLANLENLQQAPLVQAKPVSQPRGHGSALVPLAAVGAGLAIGGVVVAHELANMNGGGGSCWSSSLYSGTEAGHWTSGKFTGQTVSGYVAFTVSSGGTVTLTQPAAGTGSVTSCGITFSYPNPEGAAAGGSFNFTGTITTAIASGNWTATDANGTASGTWSAFPP